MSDEASAKNRRPPGRDAVDPPPPAVFAGRMPMHGRTVSLEPLDPRLHCDELFERGHAHEAALAIWEYLPYGPFADLTAMRDWMRSCAAQADPVFFAIRDRVGGGLGGMCSFLNIHPMAGSVEIGHIWFLPEMQGTLQTTEALFLMMRQVMDELGYRRLEWKCNAMNEDSRRAARRLGFRYEGTFYNHLIVKGCNRDTAWYSILDNEWPALRANFERWLRPDNFDDQGRQRQSLGRRNRELW